MAWLDAPSAYTTAQGKYVPAGKSERPDIGFKGHSLTPGEMAKAAQAEVARALREMKPSGKVTIEIPGDGTFTINRDPHSIQEVLSRIHKGGPSPWQGLVDKTKRGNTTYIPKETRW
jgi:hypothetical protein